MVRTKNGTTAVSSSSGNINECITLHVYVQKVNIDRWLVKPVAHIYNNATQFGDSQKNALATNVSTSKNT